MNGKVVILGAGYGGIGAAKSCEKLGYDVVLVERYESFFHKMAADRGCVVPGFENKLVLPLNKVLTRPNSQLIFGEACSIDVQSNQVLIRVGNESKETPFAYAFLIIAIGMQHSADIGQIPSRVMSSVEMCKELRVLQERIKNLGEKVAVVGGGPAGCELAAEVKYYYPDRSVHLFHSRDKLLTSLDPPVSSELSTTVQQTLEKGLGISVHLGVRKSPAELTSEGYGVLMATGLINHADSKVLLPNEWFASSSSDSCLYLEVNQYMQVKAVEENGRVFAIGDIVNSKENKQARTARRHAMCVTENINRIVQGETVLSKYEQYIGGGFFRRLACLLSTFRPDYVSHKVPGSPGVLNITLGPYYHLQASGVVWSEKGLSWFRKKVENKYLLGAARQLNLDKNWKPDETLIVVDETKNETVQDAGQVNGK